MYSHSEAALFNACRTLFGKDINLSPDFLHYLQPSGAKSAFRSQAKAHHPDAFAGSSSMVRKQQTERFREIRQAYELISDFLNKRQLRSVNAPRKTPAQPARKRPQNSAKAHSYRRPQPKPQAAVPSMSLEFGMYSFYQKKISYQQLIEALVWQRRQRPTLGALAEKWGWLTEDKVDQILSHRGHSMRFGKKAIELGYLHPHQVDALLKHQRSLQKRIGDYFVEKGLLTEEEANEIAESLKHHNSRLSKQQRRPATRGF